MLKLTVSSGPGEGSTVEIDSGHFVIGREVGCDLVLEDHRASRRHAEIVLLDDGAYEIDDLDSRNGTFVDGKPAVAPVALNGGEELKIGNTTLLVDVPGSDPETDGEMMSGSETDGEMMGEPAPDREMTDEPESVEDEGSATRIAGSPNVTRMAAAPDPLVLRGTLGPGTGKVIEPTADGTTVGREEGPDVEIDDIEVSRTHMELKLLPDWSIEIVDLESRNGTFVDGDRLSGPHILTGGETVKTGQTTFVVEHQDEGGTVISARPSG